MHKNRMIIILGIFIIILSDLGLPPVTKSYLVQIFAFLIVILAFLIEKKGVFSLDWRKRNPTTPTASTYIEHNGAAAPLSKTEDTPPVTQLPM